MTGANPADRRLAIEQLGKGTALHRAGQLGLAQSHYQRAVKLDPGNADAWHLLGIVTLQAGNLPLAVKHLRQCVTLRPAFAEAHNNLGVALRRLGRHAESAQAFGGALAARDRYAEAAYNLGLALEATGEVSTAEQALRQCLQWQPGNADAATNLGNLLRGQGRLDEAQPLLARACELAPDRAQSQANLALLMGDLGRHGEAVTLARKAVVLEPEQGHWWRIQGIAERLHQDREAAIASLRRACELDPTDETARFELALTLQESGAIDEARVLLARVKPPPGTAERLRWMRALALPAIYRDEAEVDAARLAFAQGLAGLRERLRLDGPSRIREAYQAAAGFAPFHLHYQPRDNTGLQRAFGDLVADVMRAAAPSLAEPCDWAAGPQGGRVRVGVVGSHFMRHTVSRYFNDLLADLDPERFEVTIWHAGIRDAETDALAGRVHAFTYVHGDPLDTAAAIRAARLDVLVYPELGLDPRSQVLAALRLAPVQCVLGGHPVTSGLPTIDYFLSGAAIEPPDADAHYRERLVRLPGLGARPRPPSAPGNADWLPGGACEGPLLLCLQYHIKLVPGFDAVLARIAERTGARIGFFTREPALTRLFRARVDAVFARHGLDAGRHLVDLPAQGYADYLAGVAATPLVLDTPGFSGGGTSLDALGVATPVLAFRSAMARGRQTAGMLDLIGVDDLVATDEADYVDKAVALCRDGELRRDLSGRIAERRQRLFEDRAPQAAFAAFLQDPAAFARSGA
ncbi:tetratricopeptide repeat protein [Dokdonella koreensis]|uniref:protein O-GlcNAc transferase n=1 Tax=Dokdonella koreensis DS-123 TaxID=1300342 RepID=A0A160DTH0_9GAMM|nr:tetratricopeptide repeat protein [Dokdonella koreensis]ANB17667.1 Putative O-linked N-acetylglucosamine transferase, SPINDLY family [Dokdonella koreensis DS-123]